MGSRASNTTSPLGLLLLSPQSFHRAPKENGLFGATSLAQVWHCVSDDEGQPSAYSRRRLVLPSLARAAQAVVPQSRCHFSCPCAAGHSHTVNRARTETSDK